MSNARRLQEIATVLNHFPEVRWDRTAAAGGDRVVFGWLDREEDGRSDFILFTFGANGSVGFTTSSPTHSEEFHRRLYGSAIGHGKCQRVEEVFAGEVINAITLEEGPAA